MSPSAFPQLFTYAMANTAPAAVGAGNFLTTAFSRRSLFLAQLIPAAPPLGSPADDPPDNHYCCSGSESEPDVDPDVD